MKKMKFTKETLRRALRTFLQAVVAYMAANICVVDFTAEGDVITSALFGLAVAGIAAGIAAVMNLEEIIVPEEKVEPETEPEEESCDVQLELDLGPETSEEVFE